MAHATFTASVTLKDGSTASHVAEALRYWHESDGAIVVEAACCGEVGQIVTCPTCGGAGSIPAAQPGNAQAAPSASAPAPGQTAQPCMGCNGLGTIQKPDTRSRHTFYDIARPTSDGVIDPEAEVRAHVQRVAEHHAAAHRVKSYVLDGLMKLTG